MELFCAEETMEDLTLETLARRVESLERLVAGQMQQPREKDWRRVIGMFRDSEVMRLVDEECAARREAERDAARRGESPE
jgi:hypothetical protein